MRKSKRKKSKEQKVNGSCKKVGWNGWMRQFQRRQEERLAWWIEVHERNGVNLRSLKNESRAQKRKIM